MTHDEIIMSEIIFTFHLNNFLIKTISKMNFANTLILTMRIEIVSKVVYITVAYIVLIAPSIIY